MMFMLSPWSIDDRP